MLLVYAWPPDHQHILMIVPTSLDVAQHARFMIGFDQLHGPVWSDNVDSVACLSVELRSKVMVVIDVTEAGFPKRRLDDSIETVVDIFPSMLLNEFGMTAVKRNDGNPTIGQRA